MGYIHLQDQEVQQSLRLVIYICSVQDLFPLSFPQLWMVVLATFLPNQHTSSSQSL